MSKCQSNPWGPKHKFEPRYDLSAGRMPAQVEGSAYAILKIMEMSRTQTYVCDVCEYCGQTIERKKP